MIHVMVDLETLGRRAGCKVLSIGAVVFGPSGLGAEFYSRILRAEQGDLHEDPDTIQWWADQKGGAKAELFGSDEGKVLLAQSLKDFNTWLENVAAQGNVELSVWGNGADFDNAILQSCFAEMGQAPGWLFWNNRCYRTLKGLAPTVKLVRQGTYHNALDDAKSQAEHAARLMTHLKAW